MTRAHEIGRSLSDLLGWSEASWEQVEVRESPTALATWMPIADMAAAAQGLVGLAAAAVHQARGGPAQTVEIDRWEASLSMTSAAYLTVDGEKAVSWDPLTGYHRAADGWVYTHCQFAHLRDRLLAALKLPNDPEVVKARLAQMPAQQIEDIAQAAGVCGIRMRSRDEWQAHPHGQHLANDPVVSLLRIGDASAPDRQRNTDKHPNAPLSGIKVLDLSRVIAGPMIGRTLAEHGAQVMRIGAAHLPSFDSLVIDTGFGKRAAYVDLREAEGRNTLKNLTQQADILIDGYRPGALARHGFGIDALREMNPSIVYIGLSAFGETGPWGGR